MALNEVISAKMAATQGYLIFSVGGEGETPEVVWIEQNVSGVKESQDIQ